MLEDSETRSKVLENWVELAGCVDFLPYLQFYTKNGILSRPSDLYKVGVRHLYYHADIPDEVVYSTMEKMSAFKHTSIARMLVALLPDLDIEVVKELATSPCSLPELADRCSGSLYAEGFLEELERLAQIGVEFKFGHDEIFDVDNSTPFTGKKVAVAGTLSAEPDIVKGALKSLGAEVQTDVSEDTDYLILGEKAPKEADAAIKLGVKILTETDVAAMLGV